MYNFINQNAQIIINHIDSQNQFITTYPNLCNQLHQVDVATNLDYQKKYKTFWSMNQARLSPLFFQNYFLILEKNKNQQIQIPNFLEVTLKNLYNIQQCKSTSYQYSFVSKLCHMIDTSLPIYDKFIKSFYFLPELDTRKPIDSFVQQYLFLKCEYQRIINNNLLATTFNVFNSNNALKLLNYSSTKIIDTIIWSFVYLLYKDKINRSTIYT